LNPRQHLANIVTLLNLFCGCLAITMVIQGQLHYAAFFVLAGAFFDFIDGLVARMLGISTSLGGELDSLSDVVTFGVVPGLILFSLLSQTYATTVNHSDTFVSLYSNFRYLFLAPAFLFTLAAGYRLGKFNVDTRQTKSFIGLPSPSAALFVISLPLILEYSSSNALSSIILNPWTLYGTTITGGLLMIAEWPLMGIKFQHVKWQGNEYKYILIAGSVIALIFLRFAGIPVAILFYLILSIIQNVQQK